MNLLLEIDRLERQLLLLIPLSTRRVSTKLVMTLRVFTASMLLSDKRDQLSLTSSDFFKRKTA